VLQTKRSICFKIYKVIKTISRYFQTSNVVYKSAIQSYGIKLTSFCHNIASDSNYSFQVKNAECLVKKYKKHDTLSSNDQILLLEDYLEQLLLNTQNIIVCSLKRRKEKARRNKKC